MPPVYRGRVLRHGPESRENAVSVSVQPMGDMLGLVAKWVAPQGMLGHTELGKELGFRLLDRDPLCPPHWPCLQPGWIYEWGK